MRKPWRSSLPALLACALALAAPAVCARLVVGDPASTESAAFTRQLGTALDALAKADDPRIRELVAAAAAAPGSIRVRQLTDDPATWSGDGDRNRGHTEPADGRPKREGRTTPTDATIFVPLAALEPGNARWNSGLLVHELTHALDLASGRYNRDYTVRERRATFMQNLWRQHVGAELRVSYHDRFATLDYQHAVRSGELALYAHYIFTRADFPPPQGD